MLVELLESVVFELLELFEVGEILLIEQSMPDQPGLQEQLFAPTQYPFELQLFKESQLDRVQLEPELPDEH